MTDDQLTAPERDLIQWLSDEVGLKCEAELARRLAGMRAAPSEPWIDSWRDNMEKLAHRTEPHKSLLDDLLHGIAQGATMMRAALRAPQAVAPSEGEIQSWADKWAACWNSVSLRLPRDVLKEHQVLGSEAVALMRRAAAQAPSSGNDKLRRLRAEFDVIRTKGREELGADPFYFDEVAEAFDDLLAEPSEPAAADGELVAAAEWALRAHLGEDVWAKVPDPNRPNESCTVTDALRAAIAKAREAKR